MTAARQSVRVGLKTVTQARLGDAAPAFEVVDQQVEVVAQVRLESRHERADDRGQQQRPVGRVRRQEEFAERDPARRSDDPRVTHLEFSRKHCVRT